MHMQCDTAQYSDAHSGQWQSLPMIHWEGGSTPGHAQAHTMLSSPRFMVQHAPLLAGL